MSAKAGKRPGYEELRRELDSILDELQSGSLDIDQALAKYKRGLELVGQLEKHLDKADNTVRELKARFDNGKQGAGTAGKRGR